MSRSSDRIDSADGSVDIVFDKDLGDAVFGLNAATSGWVYFIGHNSKSGRIYLGAGIPFPVKVRMVLSSGTTILATNLVGLV